MQTPDFLHVPELLARDARGWLVPTPAYLATFLTRPELASDTQAHEDHHEHDSEVNSVSFEVEKPIDAERFNAWITQVLASKGQDLLRTKGILYYEGDSRRFAFQAVHMIADGDFIGDVKDGDPKRSKIVFIGRDLNRPWLRRGFEACQVGEDEAKIQAEIARWTPPPA